MAEKKSAKKADGAAKKKTPEKKAPEKKVATEKTKATKEVVKKPAEKKEEKQTKKKAMDPRKKKLIIIWSCVGGGVLVLAIVAIILIISLTKVDYVEAYAVADELKEEIQDLKSSSCSSVVNYAGSTYTSEKEYTKYLEKCRESSGDADELVGKLENTSAVQRDEKIKRDFDKFKKEYDKVVGNNEKKEQALKLYETWHKWILASDDLGDNDESDADLEAAAKILTESGNDELKEYGETWLKYKKDLAKTYREYQNTSYGAENYSSVYEAYSKARSTYSNWLYKNAIKIAEIADWKVDSYADLYSKFNNLYETIESAYKTANGGGSGNPFGIDPSGGGNSGDYSDIMKFLGQ